MSETFGVIGAGTMGNGIAQVAARAGYNVVMRDVAEDFLLRGMNAIDKSLQRDVDKERLSADELMNAVVHDSLLWVVPERCEGIVDDDDRRHAALSSKLLRRRQTNAGLIGLNRLVCSGASQCPPLHAIPRKSLSCRRLT